MLQVFVDVFQIFFQPVHFRRRETLSASQPNDDGQPPTASHSLRRSYTSLSCKEYFLLVYEIASMGSVTFLTYVPGFGCSCGRTAENPEKIPTLQQRASDFTSSAASFEMLQPQQYVAFTAAAVRSMFVKRTCTAAEFS